MADKLPEWMTVTDGKGLEPPERVV